jgi:hypothetical protein
MGFEALGAVTRERSAPMDQEACPANYIAGASRKVDTCSGQYVMVENDYFVSGGSCAQRKPMLGLERRPGTLDHS